MSNWNEMYESKKRSMEECAKIVESGERYFIGGSASTPTAFINVLADRAAELRDVDLIGTMLLEPIKPITSADYIGHLNYQTMFYGGAEHKFYKVGNIQINSCHFVNVFDALRDVYKINGLMVDCSPMDEEGYLHLGCLGAFVAGQLVDAGLVDKVILQVNRNQCFTIGEHNKIHISKVTALCEHDHPLPILPQPPISENDQAVADNILPMIPDGACVQIGLGGLANAIGYGLMDRKNLSCQTEMFTDSMMELYKKGVLTGKMEASFALGSAELYAFAAEKKVSFVPINFTNNLERIAANDNFISINSCLMADLTGQVCSESIGHNQFSCTGGQLDFVKGARLSKGGKSFLCLASSLKKKDGTIASKITLNLPAGAVVTTPRSEVMYIVTEYGVADLMNKPIEDRVEAMIAIAHPDFRDSLRQEALAAGLLRR